MTDEANRLEDEIDIEQENLMFARQMLDTSARLRAEAGKYGKKLLEALDHENVIRFDGIVDHAFLVSLVDRYPEPVGRIVPLDPLEEAIAAKDVEGVFRCAPRLAALSGVGYGIKWQQIKEAFGKSINLNNLTKAISEEKRRIKLEEDEGKRDVADIAREWVMANRNRWAYDRTSHTWRMFDVSHWQEQNETHNLDLEAEYALHDAGIDVNSVSGINLFQRQAEARCVRDFAPKPNLINFDNGTLDLKTMQLRIYDREDELIYCLPLFYDPYSEHPTITAFLCETITEKDEETGEQIPNWYGIQALMAQFGLSLMGDTHLQKALIVQGVPRSGKTTLLDLGNMTCGLPIQNFVPHDVFARNAEGKRVRFIHGKKRIACIDEVPIEALREEEIFKAMSAHSSAGARGMYKDDEALSQWLPKLIMSCNEKPHYKDISGAIKQRLIVISCPNQRFEEPEQGKPGQDKFLADKFLPEIGAFAATCIHFAKLVLARGYFPQSAIMKRTLDEMAAEGNPLKACLEDKFNLDPQAHTITADLYAVYKAFCERHENQPLASFKFSSALCAMGLGIYAKKKHGERALVGIRLRGELEASDSAEYHCTALLEDPGQLGRLQDGRNKQPPTSKVAREADGTKQWTARTANVSKSDSREALYTDAREGEKVDAEGTSREENQNSHFAVPGVYDDVIPLVKASLVVEGKINSRPQASIVVKKVEEF